MYKPVSAEKQAQDGLMVNVGLFTKASIITRTNKCTTQTHTGPEDIKYACVS